MLPSGTPIDTREAPPLGSAIAGRYRLQRFLGAGGMGAVYDALDEQTGERVAVKVLLASVRAIEEAVSRFQREALVSGSLDSPHVVQTLDAGIDEEGHVPYMVMPLMVGLDLDQLIERLGPLHPTLAVRIARQACVALELAHGGGVVHRDIKPANVFLDHAPDGTVIVRVLDFGIAKWSRDGGGLTRTGSVMGTPVFMAPEQMVDAKRVDARTDVWSIGMSLYNALSAHVPFLETAASWVELAKAVIGSEVPPLQEVAPWVDPGLARIVHGTLIKNIEARCPSIRELREALFPFSYGSDEVTSYMFQPLALNVRQHRAPRVDLPTSWHVAKPDKPAPQLTLVDADPLLGRTLGERYTLLRSLGEGGMGAVYEVSAPDGSRLALKIIHPELAGIGSAARRRFVREAQAVQSIDNPHVVKVVEVGNDAQHEVPFIVMELLNGSDLDQLIKQRGALEPSTCARTFVQVCRGLGAAHNLGFIHRDVKPANIFLNRQPNGEVIAKLCDFGIVKQLDGDGTGDTANLTRTGGVIGSPMFMSPEQATNAKAIDQRSDIWSIGASLYQALSGAVPWPGRESVGELIVAVCTQSLTHLQDSAPWVPKELADVVHRAMRRDPAQRYQTIEELISALHPFTRDRTTVTERELRAIGRDERAVVAPRASTLASDHPPALSRGASTGGAAITGVTHTVAEPRARGARLTLGLAAVALAVAGGAVFWMRAREPVPVIAVAEVEAAAVVSSAPPTSEPSAAPPPKHTVRIAIKPPEAQVTVNGEQRKLQDGFLSLEGEPGDSFAISVQHGDQTVDKNVVITKNGSATIEAIELSVPSMTRPAVPKGATVPPVSPVAPVPKAPLPPTPKTPTAVDNW